MVKLDAGVDESQLTEKQLKARERIHLKHIISECDSMLQIMGAPVITSPTGQSDIGVQTKDPDAETSRIPFTTLS